MSHSFKDGTGREWLVEVNVQAMREVKAATGLNLFALVENEFKGLGELLADPIQLIDVLYVLCREQCQRKEITDEAFGRLFGGDMLNSAADAFVEAYINFFPKPEIRKNLRALTGHAKTAAKAAINRLEREMGKVTDEAIEKAVNERIDRLQAEKLKSPASASPASSAVIPAPGRSGT